MKILRTFLKKIPYSMVSKLKTRIPEMSLLRSVGSLLVSTDRDVRSGRKHSPCGIVESKRRQDDRYNKS